MNRFVKIFSYSLLAFFILACSEKSGLENVSADEKLKEKPAVNRLIIFCLHDIDGKGRYSVSEDELREIFDLLNDYTVVSLLDYRQIIESGRKFSRPPVVLTFDDGYISNLRKVVPLLKKYNYGATFFIYLNRYHDFSVFYKSLSELDRSIEIASHSFSHSDLRNLSDKKFFREVYLSRRKLEFLTDREIVSWAWPYGYYNDDQIKLAKRAGYEIQVSTDYRIAEYHHDTENLLPRFTIQQPEPVRQVRELLSRYEKALR